MAEPSTTDLVRRRGLRGIRPRLVGVLLVPVLAVLGLGGVQMSADLEDSAEAARATSLADALPDSFRLAIQLMTERDALYSGVGQRLERRVEAATDENADAWRADVPGIDYSENPSLRQDLVAVTTTLDDLDALREEIQQRRTADQARVQYTDAINTLVGLAGHVPTLADEGIYQQTHALSEIRTASEALGVERLIVAEALEQGEIDHDQLVELTRAQDAWTAATRMFYEETSPATQAGFDELTNDTSSQGGVGARMQSTVSTIIDDGDVDGVDLSPEEWMGISAEFIQGLEGVIIRAATDLSEDVTTVREEAQRTAVITALTILGVVSIALILAVLAARSIVGPLRRLRQDALDIAGTRLPERIRDMENADGPVDVTVRPVDVHRRDEIGEVARAFDEVHGEAVRLAGEQAQLRAHVNAMFVNLSRRSQGLVAQQLRLIDQLEANEQDPDELAHLFRLDHLATRMRRNDDSLMVIAGGEAGQSSRRPVPVLDVLRAAAGEIEHFARVGIDSTENAAIQGRAAGDLVHLLAELIENATNFSPPQAPVSVGTTRAEHGDLVVEIRDQGIGMTPEELAAANQKLQRTSGLDPDAGRMMGLVVTARLAARHGLHVELAPNDPRGVIARVVVPEERLAQPEDVPADDTSVSLRPVTEQVAKPGLATAPPAAVPPAAPAPVAPAPVVPDPVTSIPSASVPAWPAEPDDTADIPIPVTPAPEEPVTASPVSPNGLDSGLDALSAPLEPEDQEPEDASPIYAMMQSEWFTRRTSLESRYQGKRVRAEAESGPTDWSSPGDEGWRRAAEVAQREEPTRTVHGLPQRVPGRNLVPGAAESVIPSASPAATAGPRRTGGLASFQRGVSRARTLERPAEDDE